MFQHDRRRRVHRGADQPLRLALASTLFVVALAVALPGAGYALQPGTARGLDTAPAPSTWSVWTHQIRESVGELWAAVWSPVDRLLGATTPGGATASDGDPTDGSGGFDPGGGGGLLDPDGAF